MSEACSVEEKAYLRWRKHRDAMAAIGVRVAPWRGYEAENEAMKTWPSRSPERRRFVSRRYRIRQKAKALGITYAEAERMTPVRPTMARHGKHRNQDGRYARSQRVSGPSARSV